MNEKTLDPKAEKNLVDPSEPHELSQVLTGALYKVMVKIHEALKKQYSKEDGATESRPPARRSSWAPSASSG